MGDDVDENQKRQGVNEFGTKCLIDDNVTYYGGLAVPVLGALLPKARPLATKVGTKYLCICRGRTFKWLKRPDAPPRSVIARGHAETLSGKVHVSCQLLYSTVVDLTLPYNSYPNPRPIILHFATHTYYPAPRYPAPRYP